ncbi:hypothetical protein Patl1_32164 [Pistacia atlantica]|uniref:Uncharacterized protein n=1 Tax=Pistacia atlantica TaxID=434234 RepID=A0ACC1AS10_9ROSI|nr:hypothetical protein Patl1_32164 [Pistacia atlantica]
MSIKINNDREGSNRRRMMMMRLLLKKLQKRLPFLAPRKPDLSGNIEFVPDDVKEGHFVVFAVKGEETQRFVVELGFLSNPAFLRLLQQAEEEYGFEQKGAITVPCLPQELQEILENRCQVNLPGRGNWATCNSGIIQSY